MNYINVKFPKLVTPNNACLRTTISSVCSCQFNFEGASQASTVVEQKIVPAQSDSQESNSLQFPIPFVIMLAIYMAVPNAAAAAFKLGTQRLISGQC